MRNVRKGLIAVATIMLVVCGTAYARIGETTEQCIQRYGQPLRQAESTGLWMFSKADMFIFVHFYNEKADMISFRKTEENILNIPKEMTENEIQVLLQANGLGLQWRKIDTIGLYSQWQTSDATVLAQYQDGILMIATNEYMKRDADSKKAAEQEKLKEF